MHHHHTEAFRVTGKRISESPIATRVIGRHSMILLTGRSRDGCSAMRNSMRKLLLTTEARGLVLDLGREHWLAQDSQSQRHKIHLGLFTSPFRLGGAAPWDQTTR